MAFLKVLFSSTSLRSLGLQCLLNISAPTFLVHPGFWPEAAPLSQAEKTCVAMHWAWVGHVKNWVLPWCMGPKQVWLCSGHHCTPGVSCPCWLWACMNVPFLSYVKRTQLESNSPNRNLVPGILSWFKMWAQGCKRRQRRMIRRVNVSMERMGGEQESNKCTYSPLLP